MHETVESIVARLEDINTERIQDKGEIITSPKQDDKNITINEEELAASPTGTHPEDVGEGVSGTKDDRNERIYDVKESACPDNSPPDDMVVVFVYTYLLYGSTCRQHTDDTQRYRNDC